jgi:hypothetical protein
MTQDRRSGSVTAKRPPDRGGDAYAAIATDVAERGPSSQISAIAITISAIVITRRLVWGRPCQPVALKLSPGCIGEGRRCIQYP